MNATLVTVHMLFLDDDNRIILKPIESNEDCQREYINACYVDVSFALKYILCPYVYTFLPTGVHS